VATQPQVAVGAVVVRAGRLLVVRRRNPPAAGRWSLPGGRVGAGEPLEVAVRRELAEETGLAGRVGPLCGVVEHMGAGHHFVILDYWVNVGHEPARPGGDADGACWADRGGLASLELIEGLWPWLVAHGVVAHLAADAATPECP
jgi:ADP-ribose pyrophosphatase YjhB (NUDIX family)